MTFQKKSHQFIFDYLVKYRKAVILGVLALVIVDILEIIPPILLMKAVDSMSGHASKISLWGLAGLYLLVALGQSLCRYAWRVYLIKASMEAGKDIRDRFVKHLFSLSSSFFDKRRVGDLLSMATTDGEAIRMAMGPGLLTLADAIFYLTTVPFVMFYLSPTLTFWTLLPLPVIPWIIMKNEKAIHDRFLKVQESFSTISAMAQESINGMRLIKAFAKEDAQLRRFEASGLKHSKLGIHLAQVQSSFGPIMDLGMTAGLVLLLYFGGRSTISGAISIGTFVAFQRYVQKMVWPMAAIGMAISFFQRGFASAERIIEVLETQTGTPECDKELRFLPGPRAVRGEVAFRNLSFGFSGGFPGRFPNKNLTDQVPLVLKNISLTIEAGARVAFMGEVGSGKTTLLSLLPRLYAVPDEMIFIDGQDVNRWDLTELRNQVGYVGQDVFLFGESVQENITFGNSNIKVEAYSEIASVHNEVQALENGYSTLLGERGVNLSGGQKQRVTIARALAKSPPILVLDDALASVDVETEEKILTSLRARPGRNTELIAAHRISTIRDADWIVVLHKGEIRQQGSFKDLSEDRRGLFRATFNQQRLKEDFDEYIHSL